MMHAHNMEKSTECQRRALRMMARHAAHPHPVCYAVWYEYASGLNAALNRAIDAVTRRGETLGDDAMRALYREHVASNGAGHALCDCREESRREIENLRREIQQAREDALTDETSGLLNRRGFDLAFRDGPGSRSLDPNGRASLLLIDIDRFKKINDSCGHVFGDRVIRAVADILRDNLKGKDIAARYGGDEFIVLLPDTPLQGARLLAEKIRAMVACNHFRRASDKAAGVTISIGVARHRRGEALADLIERADAALYASKASGRNRVALAEESTAN